MNKVKRVDVEDDALWILTFMEEDPKMKKPTFFTLPKEKKQAYPLDT